MEVQSEGSQPPRSFQKPDRPLQDLGEMAGKRVISFDKRGPVGLGIGTATINRADATSISHHCPQERTMAAANYSALSRPSSA